ncbi:cell division protein FtsQ/DivIB [Streptomyces sp. 4N509B]|uniref:cell division protein FtsQ/DivIB n=1 Tax=Streptomyces sp. 4N509B TaxID=3457413 RepID=UPI003FD1602B
MAGTTTAERGGNHRDPADAGPPPPRRRLPRLPRLPRLSRPRRTAGSAAPSPRRRRRLLVLLLALLLLVGGFVPWALYGSDWLRVKGVSVSWEEGDPVRLTEDQVLAAADVPMGEPLVSLDTGAVRERLLDALPRVASVEVGRSWPDGVTLRVTERRPAVVMRSAGGYTEVDAAGVPFAEVARAVPGVPLLELDVGSTGSARRFGADRVREGAVAVAAALPRELRREVHTIRATSYDGITLELSGNRTVRWGSPEDTAAKVDTLGLLLRAAPDATRLDVSVPSAPAVVGS